LFHANNNGTFSKNAITPLFELHKEVKKNYPWILKDISYKGKKWQHKAHLLAIKGIYNVSESNVSQWSEIIADFFGSLRYLCNRFVSLFIIKFISDLFFFKMLSTSYQKVNGT
jgi:hypothetical protein